VVRKAILGTIGTLLIIAGALYVTIPPPYPGIFDANLNRLAESYEDGWCAGNLFWSANRNNVKNLKSEMKKCAKDNTFSHSIDHQKVIPGFCHGAMAAGFPGNYTTECFNVFTSRRMWATMGARITSAFNEQYPWPGEVFPGSEGVGGESRTGGRDGFERP
jgi:hypothetical protein